MDEEKPTVPLKLSRALALLWAYVSRRKGPLFLLGVCILAANALRLASPLVLRAFIDAISSGSEVEALYALAGVFIAMAVATQGLAIGAAWLGQDLGWRATNELRIDLARRCMSQDLAWHKRTLPGELIERVDGDVRVLMSFFSDFSIRVIGSVALMAGTLAMLLREDFRAGISIGAYSLVALFALLRVGMVAVPHWAKSRAKSAEFFGFAGEALSGREDLRSMGAVSYARAKAYAMLRRWLPIRMRANLFGYTMWTSSVLASAVGTALALALGAWLWSAGAASLGTVYLIYAYMDLLWQPIDQLREQIEGLQKAMAGAARSVELLEAQPGMRFGEAALARFGAVSLAFERVRFSYDGESDAIGALSFELAPGESLGVVGRTGCGKTTLGRLALRLYDANEGRILLDGVPIGEYSRESLRESLAVVTQDVEIFSGTVRDNATLWDRSIPDERVLAAFDDLGLSRWLATFPAGLDQTIGSGGSGLSAGQAQLLALARAFLRSPRLVVLDEASSRLDPATEALVDGAVTRLLAGRTAIIIAHRLSTLDRVDTIMVMESGRAAEFGPRRALAADPGSRFRALLAAGAELGGAELGGAELGAADRDGAEIGGVR
jgi:ATP-binding cassette subfamily B protein